MRVYSYETSQPSSPDHHELVDLWHQAWASCGFEPVMLSERDAARHPDWVDATKFVYRHCLGDPYTPHLQAAKWLRWLAFSRIFGGALCVEPHVLPRPRVFDPDQLKACLPATKTLTPLTANLDSSAFWLSSGGYTQFCGQWVKSGALDPTLGHLTQSEAHLKEPDAFREVCKRYDIAPVVLVQPYGPPLDPGIPLIQFSEVRVNEIRSFLRL